MKSNKSNSFSLKKFRKTCVVTFDETADKLLPNPDPIAEDIVKLTPKEIISQLPISRIWSNSHFLRTGEICNICFQKFHIGEYVNSLPCKKRHKFHTYCAENWINHVGTYCPIDREELYQKKRDQVEISIQNPNEGVTADKTDNRDNLESIIGKATSALRTLHLKNPSPPTTRRDFCAAVPENMLLGAGDSAVQAIQIRKKNVSNQYNKTCALEKNVKPDIPHKNTAKDSKPDGRRCHKPRFLQNCHEKHDKNRENFSETRSLPPGWLKTYVQRKKDERTQNQDTRFNIKPNSISRDVNARMNYGKDRPMRTVDTFGETRNSAFTNCLNSTKMGKDTVWVLKPQSFNAKYFKNLVHTPRTYVNTSNTTGHYLSKHTVK